ncbi:L1Tc protein [Trypanosoma cruzi]|nr:L1Tc protein [Trypanosoma cruzi]
MAYGSADMFYYPAHHKWRSTIRQDTHRYLLCGTRPSDLSGKDLITQEVLHRQELVHLARARCGESELWGRLYWAVRDCTNQCRFCDISPEQSAYMRSNNDPTAPGTDTVSRRQGRKTSLQQGDGPSHAVGRRNVRTVILH